MNDYEYPTMGVISVVQNGLENMLNAVGEDSQLVRQILVIPILRRQATDLNAESLTVQQVPNLKLKT